MFFDNELSIVHENRVIFPYLIESLVLMLPSIVMLYAILK